MLVTKNTNMHTEMREQPFWSHKKVESRVPLIYIIYTDIYIHTYLPNTRTGHTHIKALTHSTYTHPERLEHKQPSQNIKPEIFSCTPVSQTYKLTMIHSAMCCDLVDRLISVAETTCNQISTRHQSELVYSDPLGLA